MIENETIELIRIDRKILIEKLGPRVARILSDHFDLIRYLSYNTIRLLIA